MGREAKVTKQRKCKYCFQYVETDSQTVVDHEKGCQGAKYA